MPPDQSPALSRRARLLVIGQVWSLVVVGLVGLCGAYIESASPTTWRGGLFLYGGRLSCAASLSVIPGLLCLAIAALVRAKHVLALVTSLLWTLTLFLVYVDTRIYEIFRYHFNGLVWNVLTTPGADEAVQLSRREVWLVLLSAAALLALLIGVFHVLWRWTERRAVVAKPTPRLARPGLAWSLVLAPNMLMVAGVYAWADLQRDPQVMAFARVYPLYPRLTVKRIAERFGFHMKDRAEVDMPAAGILLDYPKSAVVLPPYGPRPNIVIVVVDSLRADMLDPEVMPRVTELAARGRTFRDHLSCGNATRFGLFGLVYGLHGSYWKAVYDEHRSPVLVDALLAAGYEMRVLTSASMDFPEFRSTAWVRIEAAVEDRLPSERPGGRDDGVAKRFDEWLGERADPERPFFAFMLLDAPHQRYWFPEECAVFRPYLDDIAYSAIDDDAPAELRTGLFNRYRNAVHYADQTTGRILDALTAHGLSEETLVVVTGDHGEEFFENGFWGHTSNFTRAQAHVPFVLAGPAIPPGEEERPTSHIDLPSTLLELLGADPAARPQWTLGANLLDPPAVRARVVSGWETLGLHAGSSILEIPMASHGGTGIAVYDQGWKRVFEDSAPLAENGRTLATLALECRRFLR